MKEQNEGFVVEFELTWPSLHYKGALWMTSSCNIIFFCSKIVFDFHQISTFTAYMWASSPETLS